MSGAPALLSGGELQAWEGSNPVLLESSHMTWQVQQGHVDLFAVTCHADRPVGRRHFLQRVLPGGLILGLPRHARENGDDLAIIAVGGLDSVVRATPWTDLETLAPAPLTALVEQWIACLSKAIAEGVSRWPERVITQNGVLELQAQERVFGQPGKIFWVQSGAPLISFMGGAARGPGPLPITANTWVQAQQATSLRCLDTADLIGEKRLHAALLDFHAEALPRIANCLSGAEQQWEQRIRDIEEVGQQALGTSLLSLAALIRPGRYRRPRVAGSGSPLLQVCREVGRSLDIPITDPQRAETAADSIQEELGAILRASRLRHRRVILKMGWWKRDNGALVGYRLDGAPVALVPHGPRAYRLFDPAGGAQGRVTEDIAAGLRPEADMLYRPFPDRALSLMEFLRFGMHGVSADLRRVFMMGTAGGLLALTMPIATGLIIDTILPRAAVHQLWQMAAALLATALGLASFKLVQSLALLRVESRMDWSMQAAVFDRLLKLPASFFKRYTSGDLGDRVLGVQAMRQLLSTSATGALLSALFTVFSFLLLFIYSIPLALIASLLVAVAVLVTATFGFAFLRHERDRVQHQGQVEGLVLQLVGGAAKLRVAAAENRALATWGGRYARQKHHQVAAQRWSNWQGVFAGQFPILASMCLYGAIVWLLQSGTPDEALQTAAAPPLSAGSFLAFNAAFGQFLGAMTALAGTLTQLLAIIPLYERARPILDGVPESAAGGRDPGVLMGHIELSSIYFRYSPDMPWVLDGLNVQIAAGEFVAIVGASGSGKSTLLRLLLGFEQAQRGEVFFDGRAMGTLDIPALRSQIGVVLQHGRISTGSLFENIVGASNLTPEDAWRAARLVGLDQDIEAMPMGMHTVLTEGGGTLSGGQRQRLLIARALVRQPRILLLDEATSALDNRTQAIVTKSLEALNITRMVIAHRLSTIRHVDRILVLEAGRIVESGSYDELMSRDGVFKQLATRQLM